MLLSDENEKPISMDVIIRKKFYEKTLNKFQNYGFTLYVEPMSYI